MTKMMTSVRSSRPDGWSVPKPYSDPSTRRMKYGRIRPMEEDEGVLARFFRRFSK
jgi:hypothetical protein